jgi:hypothetical protein
MDDRAAIVEEWSFRIAESVSPHEAILAPSVAEDFMAGGKRREQLFKESRGVLGGIGAGDLQLIMPAILSAIAAAGPVLIAALSSPLADSAVGALDNALELLKVREERQTPKSSPTVPIPDNPELAPLLKVLDAMQSELRAKGVSADVSEAAAYRALRAMVEVPQSASQFVVVIAS